MLARSLTTLSERARRTATASITDVPVIVAGMQWEADERFVREAMARLAEAACRPCGHPPAEKQSRAVFTLDERTLLVASAGSAKTIALVEKLLYAVEHGTIASELSVCASTAHWTFRLLWRPPTLTPGWISIKFGGGPDFGAETEVARKRAIPEDIAYVERWSLELDRPQPKPSATANGSLAPADAVLPPGVALPNGG